MWDILRLAAKGKVLEEVRFDLKDDLKYVTNNYFVGSSNVAVWLIPYSIVKLKRHLWQLTHQLVKFQSITMHRSGWKNLCNILDSLHEHHPKRKINTKIIYIRWQCHTSFWKPSFMMHEAIYSDFWIGVRPFKLFLDIEVNGEIQDRFQVCRIWIIKQNH